MTPRATDCSRRPRRLPGRGIALPNRSRRACRREPRSIESSFCGYAARATPRQRASSSGPGAVRSESCERARVSERRGAAWQARPRARVELSAWRGRCGRRRRLGASVVAPRRRPHGIHRHPWRRLGNLERHRDGQSAQGWTHMRRAHAAIPIRMALRSAVLSILGSVSPYYPLHLR
jgi:hypothetical protein